MTSSALLEGDLHMVQTEASEYSTVPGTQLPTRREIGPPRALLGFPMASAWQHHGVSENP